MVDWTNPNGLEEQSSLHRRLSVARPSGKGARDAPTLSHVNEELPTHDFARRRNAMRILVLTSVLAVIATARMMPPSADAQGSRQAPAIAELRYAGTDPLREDSQSAIFMASLGNNSDDPITAAEVTVDLGYRWGLADSADWRCAVTPDLMGSCARTLPPIAPHLGLELPIVMGSAAGVCLSASPSLRFVLQFPSGETVVSASATAPSRCSGQNSLPATGQSDRRAPRLSRRSLILLLLGTMLLAGGVGVRAARIIRSRE